MRARVALALLCACGPAPGAGRAVPEFTVDLDVDAGERWREVALHYKWALPAMMDNFKAFLEENLESGDMARWETAINASVTPEISQELDGVLKYTDSPKLTRRILILRQAMYELQFYRGCSGMLAAMENGTVVHGRNMDYILRFVIDGKVYNLRDVTFDVTFVRGNVPIMTSVHWPGQLGIHTAMRFGGWTFEQNTRYLGNDRKANLAAGLLGSVPLTLFARKQMETIKEFRPAVDAFQKANFMAPSYFIIAGTGEWEGAVLTISREGGEDGCSKRVNSEDDWLLLQTNDDWCGMPFDYRRHAAKAALPNRLNGSRSVSTSTILDFMTRAPLMNYATVFTWVAVPATGYHHSVVPDEKTSLREKLSRRKDRMAQSIIGVDVKLS